MCGPFLLSEKGFEVTGRCGQDSRRRAGKAAEWGSADKFRSCRNACLHGARDVAG